MSAQDKLVATPKKGPVVREGASLKGDAHAGSYKKTKVIRRTGYSLLLNKVTGVKSGNRSLMLAKIRKGLPFKAVEDLEHAYGATRKEIGGVLAIPISTLSRRQKTGYLLVDESDRVARLAQIKDAVLAMMQGDDDAAIAWLRTPQGILNNETPLDHASTEMGSRDVEDLIGRIRHGVFS